MTYLKFIVATAYSTGYTSLLTAPRLGKRIDTFADIIKSGLKYLFLKIIQTIINENIALAHCLELSFPHNIHTYRNILTIKVIVI